MGGCCKTDVVADSCFRLNPAAPLLALELHCARVKETSGLFELHLHLQAKQLLSFTSSSVLTRRADRFFSRSLAGRISPSEEGLLALQRREQGFVLKRLVNQERPPWLLLSSLRGPFQLQEDDVLKLGRFTIKVKEVCRPCQTQPQPVFQTKTYYFGEGAEGEGEGLSTGAEEECRACLEPGRLQNPLLSLCKCTGGSKFIHLACLREWLAKRLEPTVQGLSVTVQWKNLSCQICKHAYPHRIFINGRKLDTVEIPKPLPPFMCLQVMTGEDIGEKTYYYISFREKEKLLIGRKHDVDIKISDDSSVSRHHAFFRYDSQSQCFEVEDCNSKYGTMALLRKALNVNFSKGGLALLVGSYLVRLNPVVDYGQPDCPRIRAADSLFLQQDPQFFLGEQRSCDIQAQEAGDRGEVSSNEGASVGRLNSRNELSPLRSSDIIEQ